MDWVQGHWFELLQTVGIVGGLAFTALARIQDARSRRISNLIAFKQEHREIWKELYSKPNLNRVLKREVDLTKNPISEEEALFVKMLILHLGAAHEAIRMRLFIRLDGLQKDISTFFSYPIPRAIWDSTKQLQNRDFVDFVEKKFG